MFASLAAPNFSFAFFSPPVSAADLENAIIDIEALDGMDWFGHPAHASGACVFSLCFASLLLSRSASAFVAYLYAYASLCPVVAPEEFVDVV